MQRRRTTSTACSQPRRRKYSRALNQKGTRVANTRSDLWNGRDWVTTDCPIGQFGYPTRLQLTDDNPGPPAAVKPVKEIENGRVGPAEAHFIGRVAEPQSGSEIRRAVADVVLLDDRSMGGEVIDHERHEFAGEPVGLGGVGVAAQPVDGDEL